MPLTRGSVTYPRGHYPPLEHASAVAHVAGGSSGRSDSLPARQTLNQKPNGPKPKLSRWDLFALWFNTYKKFFTFVISLNATGVTMAALGRFPYAENHLGALVLGNLLMAVLMRNELFLRCLYAVGIYGLRSVCLAFVPRLDRCSGS